MKRVLAQALCVCIMTCSYVLCGALGFSGMLGGALGSPGAIAEESRSAMKLMELGDSAYWREHPEIPVEDAWYSPWDDRLGIIQGDDAPDVMILRTNNCDFAAIKEAGVLSDLSGSESIRQAVGRMRPEARQLVTTEAGEIIGLPVVHMAGPVYWYQEAWDAAGLGPEDVPQSYTELLDFLEIWSERVAERPEKKVCVSHLVRGNTGVEKHNYTNWLMEILVNSWLLQQEYAVEPAAESVGFHSPGFDSPEFAALAERTRDIGEKLYEAEPKESKRQKMLQLFQSDINGGEHANDGRDYGFSHTLPMRITADQPALMLGHMNIACVRAGSPWLPEALDFLEQFKEQQPFFFRYTLYTDFKPGSYTAPSLSGTYYTISEGWLEDYRHYEGTLVYFQQPSGDEYYALLKKFYGGKLSAEELGKGLEESIAKALP